MSCTRMAAHQISNQSHHVVAISQHDAAMQHLSPLQPLPQHRLPPLVLSFSATVPRISFSATVPHTSLWLSAYQRSLRFILDDDSLLLIVYGGPQRRLFRRRSIRHILSMKPLSSEPCVDCCYVVAVMSHQHLLRSTRHILIRLYLRTGLFLVSFVVADGRFSSRHKQGPPTRRLSSLRHNDVRHATSFVEAA